MKIPGSWAMRVSMAFAILVFTLIGGMANFIMRGARQALLEDAARRTESFARTAREALAPKLDLFWLHFLVNDLSRDKVVRYVLISDPEGKVLSHSLPEKIGGRDNTPEGMTARAAPSPRFQTYTGPDGLDYYYFSAPIALGRNRLGTAAVALNTETISAALADTRRKLTIILAAAFLALLLVLVIRRLVNLEQRAARLKSEMVHTVSHEFNNALASIDAYIYLLRESEPPPGDEDRDRTYRSLTSASRLLKLYVKNILNEARMASGKFRIERSPVSLAGLSRESIAAMAEFIRQKSISMTLDTPAGCRPLVHADQEALALVVANLIGNAVKYTPNQGEVGVAVTLAEKPPSVVFTVRNTGPGIAAADLERITAGFYRTPEGRAAAEGFGLGLKISSDMLQLHGSRLEVASEPGKGSVFSFTLPLLESECSVPPGQENPPAPAA